jgi:hypothetical protein
MCFTMASCEALASLAPHVVNVLGGASWSIVLAATTTVTITRPRGTAVLDAGLEVLDPVCDVRIDPDEPKVPPRK